MKIYEETMTKKQIIDLIIRHCKSGCTMMQSTICERLVSDIIHFEHGKKTTRTAD